MRTRRLRPLAVGHRYFITAVLLFVLAGCAGFGRIVAVDNRIPLVEGEVQQGTYNEDGSGLEYRYNLSGDV